MFKIRDFVDAENMVHFSYYQRDYFWYCVRSIVDQELYIFPIPREDVADGRMLHTDKAITYMRWIRQAIVDGTMKKEVE
jgi:hypothetical protein